MRAALKSGQSRYFFLLFIFCLLISGVAVRLFFLQVMQHGVYAANAQKQHQVQTELFPRRGEIFIQEKGDQWHPLAVNRNFKTVFLVPKEVVDQAMVAESLAPLVGVDQEIILKKVSNANDPYEPLKSKLDDETAAKIESLKLAGIYLIDENWRWYPQGNLAAHVLGFVGRRDEARLGQYGLEQYYEMELQGQRGFLSSEKDALGRWLLLGDYSREQEQDGTDLYLTLDQNIQYALQQKIKGLAEKWQASGACALVLEPKTGAIRAMVSWPDFDPNNYQVASSTNVFINSCVQQLYEPGSIFKPIVMAAGLDSAKISPQTTFVDKGILSIGGYTIQNSQQKVYGVSTMTQVLEKSINTGVVFVEQLIGGELFKKYIEAFGFGEMTGVDLAGEVSGNLKNIRENREINYATAAFGQGVSMTPLGMALAISAIANDGKLMKPFMVEKMVMANGEEKKTEPQVWRQVITPATAAKLTAMLVSTVRNGYDKIKIANYFVAGKTGTAQIATQQGYSETETNHSFVGYAPAYNPKFLILIKLEKPQGIEFASESLAPAFGELTQYLLNYYEIPPEE